MNMNNNNGMITNEVTPPIGVPGPIPNSPIITSPVEEKPKKKGKAILIIFLLLLVAALGGIGYWYYNSKKTNPVTVYENAINSFYDVLASGVKNINNATGNQVFKLDPFNEAFTIGLKAKMDTNIADLKEFSGYEYKISGGIDYKNKKLAFKGNIDKNGSELIDAFLLQTNNNLYLKSLKSFSKVLNLGNIDLFEELDLSDLKKELEDTFGSSNATIDTKDLDKVILNLKNIIVSSLDKNKFTIKDDEVTVDGNKIKVKKVSYNLDKENQERTAKYIFAKMAEDEVIVNFLAEISDQDKNTIKSGLQKVMDNVNSSANTNTKVNEGTISLYVDSDDKIVAGDIESNNKKTLTFTNGAKLIIKVEETQIIINRQKDYDDLSIVINNNEMLGFKSYKLEKEFKLEIRINISSDIKGSAELRIKNTNITADKISSELGIKFDVTIDGKNYKFTGELGIDFAKGNIETFDTTNNVSIMNLSEQDLNEIINNLDKALKGTPFYEIVEQLKVMTPDTSIDSTAIVKCANAFDCNCSIEPCTCKYIDSNIVEEITCPSSAFSQ